ncbi:MAG: hypothetical protein HFG75_12835 [Hungatella sp.]|nr:hypothetical protein [Hungatella sp.]
MLHADKRDYRNGYYKHFRLYKKLHQENGDLNSRRMILIYSVECGLKYKLLDKWNENDPRNVLDGKDEKKKSVLTSHNLEKIIKELGQQGNFKFPQLETIHKDFVSSESYHQLYRYCIRTQEKDREKEEKLEETLRNIADWIEEGM